MHHVIAAACTTGSTLQKWKCGWNQPTTTAANAGYFAGHSIAPWAIILGVVIGVIWLASRSRSRAPATGARS